MTPSTLTGSVGEREREDIHTNTHAHTHTPRGRRGPTAAAGRLPLAAFPGRFSEPLEQGKDCGAVCAEGLPGEGEEESQVGTSSRAYGEEEQERVLGCPGNVPRGC